MDALLASLIVFCLIVGYFVNYVIDKDEADIPPLYYKLWLIPVLSLLIIIPILFLVFIYFLVIKGTSGIFSGLLHFSTNSVVGVVSFWTLIPILLCEFLVHPIIHSVFKIHFKNADFFMGIFIIFLDAIIVYINLRLIPGIRISSFFIALLISFVLFTLNSIGNVLNNLIKSNKNRHN